jgi:voltage-gated potassium channel
MPLSNHLEFLFFRHRFAVLLALLFFVVIIPPYFEAGTWMDRAWRLLFTLVLLWTLYTVHGSRRVLIFALLAFVPTVLSTWIAQSIESEIMVLYLDNLTNILYFGLICAYLAAYIFSARKVTSEVLFAAMCLYMALAFLWAAIYTNLHLFYGDAFNFYGGSAAAAGIGPDQLYPYMLYYSFVTLSTLGYGDIVPSHQVAQNWAAVEAMIGQFFIAVVIARLVSLYTLEQHG